MAQRTCTIDGCDGRHFGKSFCQKHYQRWRKHGDPLYEAERNERLCIVEGCGRTLGRSSGRGMCSKHYQRFKKHGDPGHVRQKRVGIELCAVDDCGQVVKARDVCAAHLHRLYRYGSESARVRAEVIEGRRICPRCGLDKPLSEWVERGGRLLRCLSCDREYNANWSHVRRATVGGRADEPFTRLEVMERDEWTCQLCGGAIDGNLLWPNPMSPSLDHRIPLARGGAHSKDNTQASHLRCNLAKGARLTA